MPDLSMSGGGDGGGSGDGGATPDDGGGDGGGAAYNQITGGGFGCSFIPGNAASAAGSLFGLGVFALALLGRRRRQEA
jgi:MYXO-CTERM domain-containing protein